MSDLLRDESEKGFFHHHLISWEYGEEEEYGKEIEWIKDFITKLNFGFKRDTEGDDWKKIWKKI